MVRHAIPPTWNTGAERGMVVEPEQAMSIAALSGARERTIIMDGFSKTYAMSGWRLGFGIMPQALADKVALLLTHSVGCSAAFTQTTGIEALTGPQDQVELVRQEFKYGAISS